MPDFGDQETINILEPSVGLGNFLPSLFVKYANVNRVNLDVCDIDENSIVLLKELLKTLVIPTNFHINFIVADTLLYNFTKRYDIVVGNPPYKKLKGVSANLQAYKANAVNKTTNNLFAFFIEKAIQIGRYVALIVPKSLINSPEYNTTRELMNKHKLASIIDYGETAFKKVKIETISFVLYVNKKPSISTIESYITQSTAKVMQTYITDNTYPYWLIYRDAFFDSVAETLQLGIFTSYRDRSITKNHTLTKGKYRVLKSRNIGTNCIVDIPDYDTYINDIGEFNIAKFLDDTTCILVPNLTYYPRACRMPKGCIADGSVAILNIINSEVAITDSDLAYYSSEEFTAFYKIARNLGTRSLNIDNNSVFFFGKKIK